VVVDVEPPEPFGVVVDVVLPEPLRVVVEVVLPEPLRVVVEVEPPDPFSVVVVVGGTQSCRRKLRVLRAVDGSPVPESMKTEYCPEAGRSTAEPGGRPLWIVTVYVSSCCGSMMR
jgi:hypothetical protein